MAGDRQIAFRVFEGPNRAVPFAAVIAECDNPAPGLLPARDIARLSAELLPGDPPLKLEPASDNVDLPALAALFAKSWQEQVWRYTPRLEAAKRDDGSFRIASSFYDPEATKTLLHIAISLANAYFLYATGAVQPAQANAVIEQVYAALRNRPLSIATATLIRLAAKRGIPVYAVGAKPFTLFGQGAKGVYFSNMSNQNDSNLGWSIAGNKALTTRFLRQLGFPSTEQEVARDSAAARRIMQSLGFPLVVKPPDRGAGLGVTAEIITEEEFAQAFEKARKASRSGEVVIERFVKGDDHRISVLGGKMMRVTRLLPPRITGDGTRTIVELIEEKNRNIPANVNAVGFFSGHKIDAELIALLRKQGFGPQDRPPEGAVLHLRTTSNLHTGGSTDDATAEIHPDNVAMAEAIARTFHLDAAGIDFVTPDIGAPWHQTECAIIEVNTNPGVRHEPTLERMLAEKFPEGTDGRIPSVLIVGGEDALVESVVEWVEKSGKRTGFTDAARTRLAGQPRFAGAARLPDRIKALLMDASCEALVVSCGAEAISAHGLPHTRYDLALIAEGTELPEDVLTLVKNNAKDTVVGVTTGGSQQSVLSSVAELLARR